MHHSGLSWTGLLWVSLPSSTPLTPAYRESRRHHFIRTEPPLVGLFTWANWRRPFPLTSRSSLFNTIAVLGDFMEGAFGDSQTRYAVTRQVPVGEPVPVPETPLAEPKPQKSSSIDPGDATIIRSLRTSNLIADPIYSHIPKWRDRQQHGRLTYEAMLKHPEVSSSLDALMAFLLANKPHVRGRIRDPTATQKEILDYCTHVIQSMDWERFIRGSIGYALTYGFSLTEIVTRLSKWRGKTVFDLDHLNVLPQATLDAGFVPREEFGDLSLSIDPRYRCFTLDAKGRIEAIHQFAASNNREDVITWRGREIQRVLHVKRGGVDGNPFGESILYAAFYAWSNLYMVETQEQVHLDTAMSILFGTYKTQNGISRPDLHASVENKLEQQSAEGTKRFMMWADGDLKSVSPTNPDYAAHAKLAKEELRRYIRKAILMPDSLTGENDVSESDSRNIVQVFFKHILRAHQAWVGNNLRELLKRLVRANYPNAEDDEVPDPQWSNVTENELRVAQAIVQQAVPLMDSDRLGSTLHRIFPFLEPQDFPADHANSVAVKRATPTEPTGGGDPPPKEPGSVRRRDDGQTDTPGVFTNTQA